MYLFYCFFLSGYIKFSLNDQFTERRTMRYLYPILATSACVVLLCCSIVSVMAQTSNTWWKVATTANTTTTYTFGLYEICLTYTTGDNNQTCFAFSKKGIEQLQKQYFHHRNITDLGDEGRIVWTISFLALVFTAFALVVALPATFISYRRYLPTCVPILLCVSSGIGTVMGAASVYLGYMRKNVLWGSGVDALVEMGEASGDVDFTGSGRLMQQIYSICEIIACLLYAIMLKVQSSKTGRRV